MAKKNKNTAPNGSEPAMNTFEGFELPDGLVEQTDDIVGVWDPDTGPLFFTPLNAALSDSTIDRTKPSILVFGILEKDHVLFRKDGEETVEVQGKVGDRVGVWAKPGMSKLRDLANIKVLIGQSGEKNVGKGNPMKTFKTYTASAVKFQTLQVIADRRKESKSAPTFLTRDEAVTTSDGRAVDETAASF